jgi:hypothetical protein
LALGIAACTIHPAKAAIPPGSGTQSADLGGVPLQVFTYRPDGCAISGILLVFHGLERDAAEYRNHAIPLGQRLCVLAVAPLFDAERFPTWRYQRGGIVRHGTVEPAENQTVALVPRLVAWIRAQENRPDLGYAMLGHSAGGQFLDRVAAFVSNDATRIVIANPSTWVRPTLDIAAPYGFGGVYDRAHGDAALRRYLAAPITVLLGEKDTGSDDLVTNDEADAQGGTRLERGQNVFREAAFTARQHGWPCNWRLVVVPGVGHNARRMFASDQALAALRP